MRNFFYRLSSATARFMYGRTGGDQLNVARRANARFSDWRYPIQCRFSGARQRRLDKEHKYFTCKTCKTICRVPAGKGKIEITCPKCGQKIIGKS